MNIAVIGAGAWGTALALHFNRCEHTVSLFTENQAMADEIRGVMDALLQQAQAAVGAAEEVRQGNNDQQVALGETLNAVNGMLGDINSTVDGVKLISEGADTCETAKDAVVDTMSALSAISEENAASSEETGASMQELSATVTTLAGSANDLKKIAEKLNEEMHLGHFIAEKEGADGIS